MAKVIADPLKPAGSGYNQLTAVQRENVVAIIEEYLDRMPDDLATQRRNALLQAGTGTIHTVDRIQRGLRRRVGAG
jgi:hypothetical protein